MAKNVKLIDGRLLSTACAAGIVGLGGLLLNAGLAQATPIAAPGLGASTSIMISAGPGGGCTNYFGGSGSPNTGTNAGGNGTGAGGVLGGAPGALPQPVGPGGSASDEVKGGSGCGAVNPDGQGAGTSTP